MAAPRMLNVGLLEEFAARLEAQGVPAIRCAKPGLSEEVMQQLVAPLGLSLPREALIWWGWHDGVDTNAVPGSREIGPSRKWLPLAEAVAECV